MSEYGGFPMSVIVTGFFVTSLAYLICFCCCIVQFFLRRNRALAQNNGQNIFGQNIHLQKNERLKRKFMKNFSDSLRRFKKSRASLPTSFVKQEGLPESCPICFEEYLGNVEEIVIGFIKPCKHFYHFDCIWKWLENRGNCPLCREKVKLKEDDIKGIALRNLPKYLKDKGITISKQDHVVINLKSDSDSELDATSQVDPTEEATNSAENSEPSCSYSAQQENNVATIVINSTHSLASGTQDTGDSGTSEVYVKNTRESAHTPLAETQSPNHDDSEKIASSESKNEYAAATKIIIRADSDKGVDNVAFDAS